MEDRSGFFLLQRYIRFNGLLKINSFLKNYALFLFCSTVKITQLLLDLYKQCSGFRYLLGNEAWTEK